MLGMQFHCWESCAGIEQPGEDIPTHSAMESGGQSPAWQYNSFRKQLEQLEAYS